MTRQEKLFANFNFSIGVTVWAFRADRDSEGLWACPWNCDWTGGAYHPSASCDRDCDHCPPRHHIQETSVIAGSAIGTKERKEGLLLRSPMRMACEQTT